MYYEDIRTNVYRVGGHLQSPTISIENKLFDICEKLVFDNCILFTRKISMVVKENTIKTEGLGRFLKNVGKASATTGRKISN